MVKIPNGKTARLPKNTRDESNQRLENDEPARSIPPWFDPSAPPKKSLIKVNQGESSLIKVKKNPRHPNPTSAKATKSW